MIVNGKQIANRIKEEIKSLASSGPQKSLAIFYVGNNQVIEGYINRKKKFGAEISVHVEVFRLPESIDTEEIIRVITEKSTDFDGSIVQLPLPEHLDRKKILNCISPEKDVDVLADISIENFSKWKTTRLPPVVGAIEEIIREYNIDLKNKKILVVGMGSLVGKPVSLWLSREGYVFDIVNKETENITHLINKADVIISGTGVPWLIKKDMVKDGVILLDAGTATDGVNIKGDIDIDCAEKASIFSTVPGGIGPITVARLFKNLFL